VAPKIGCNPGTQEENGTLTDHSRQVFHAAGFPLSDDPITRWSDSAGICRSTLDI